MIKANTKLAKQSLCLFAIFTFILFVKTASVAQSCPGNIMLNPSLEDAGNTTFPTTFEGTPAFFLNSGRAVERIPNWFFLPGQRFDETDQLGLFYLNKSGAQGDPADGSKYLWLRGNNLCAYIGTVLTDQCTSYNLCFQGAAYSPTPLSQAPTDFAIEFWFTNSNGGFVQHKYDLTAPASNNWNDLNWNTYCQNITFPAGYDKVEILVSGQENVNGITLDDFCIIADGCGGCHDVIIAGDDVCKNESTTLTSTITNASTVLKYQWESSADGLNWSPIAGANQANYTSAPLTNDTWFRSQVIDLQKGTANPLGPAAGFNVFVKDDANLQNGTINGPFATGKDLNLLGYVSIGNHNVGTFVDSGDTIPSALIIGEKINFTNGSGIDVFQNGLIKVGNLNNTNVWTSQNGSAVPTRITQNNYTDLPKIQTTAFQNQTSVGPKSPIDFADAFTKLEQNSAALLDCNGNTTAQIVGGNALLTLESFRQNVVDLTVAQLSSITSFSFNSVPSSSRPLVINVETTGAINWTIPSFAGILSSHGQHIVWNFTNATSLIINGSNTLYGNILAPKAHVQKNGTAGTFGQIIAKTYTQNGGIIGYQKYDGVLRYQECSAPCRVYSNTIRINTSEPSASVISVDQNQICEGGSVLLTSQNTGSNLSYQWQYSSNGSTWFDITGTNQSSYTTGGLTASTHYRLIAEDSSPCPAAISNSQWIEVKSDPIINVSTTTPHACVGASIELVANTSGGVGNCQIQWQKSENSGQNWSNIAGANQANYQTPALTADVKFRATYVCSAAGCCN